MQIGRYDCFLVAPVTANTTAKVAWGIADTIITNAVAQVAKTDIPIFMLPVDQHPGTTVTTRPGGEKLELKIRRVDLENAERLRTMEGIRVLGGPGDIAPALREVPSVAAGAPR
jgi:flavoprotein